MKKLLLAAVAVVAAIIIANMVGPLLGTVIVIFTVLVVLYKTLDLLQGGVNRLSGGNRGEMRPGIQGVEEPPD